MEQKWDVFSGWSGNSLHKFYDSFVVGNKRKQAEEFEMMWLIKQMVLSFFITVVAEEIMGWIWRVKSSDECFVIFLVNVITNLPLVFMLNCLCLYFSREALLILEYFAEAGIWLLEGWIYSKRLPYWRHPWLFSLTANLFSYGIGIMIS